MPACSNQVIQAGFVQSDCPPCRHISSPETQLLRESVCLKGKVQLAIRSLVPVTQTHQLTYINAHNGPLMKSTLCKDHVHPQIINVCVHKQSGSPLHGVFCADWIKWAIKYITYSSFKLDVGVVVHVTLCKKYLIFLFFQKQRKRNKTIPKTTYTDLKHNG